MWQPRCHTLGSAADLQSFAFADACDFSIAQGDAQPPALLDQGCKRTLRVVQLRLGDLELMQQTGLQARSGVGLI